MSFGIVAAAAGSDQYSTFAEEMVKAGVNLTYYQEVANKCETKNVTFHWNYTRPVTDVNNITYKNIYCAQCFAIAQRY